MLRSHGLHLRSIIAPLLVLSVFIGAATLVSAQTPGTRDSVTDSARPAADSAQQRFLQGLRTAGRGVQQIKTAIDLLNRAHGSRDSSRVKVAAKRLTAYCSAARGFIASGRGKMDPAAYDPPTRKQARDLTLQ